MSKKKIVILGSAHPLRGGISAFNERLAKEFIDQGNDVVIYSFSLQYPNFLFPGTSQFTTDAAPANLGIKTVVNSVNPFNWIKVGTEIKNLKPDWLVVGYWLPFMAPCLGTISRLVRKNKLTRIFSVVHNMIPHEKRIGDKVLSSYFTNSVDAFVAMSTIVLDDINTFDVVKPRVFSPHPLYDNFGKKLDRETAADLLGLSSDAKYVLFFGFIRAYKGLDILLEAMADKRIRQLGVKCIVAGEFYEDAERYHEIISSLEIEDNVILKTDFIPNDEVNRFFSLADLVVQPYKSATQSGVTQIGFHFEVPMLVTNVGGLKDIIPHGKVGYVTDTNSESVANSMVDFFEKERANEFKQNLIEEKKKYHWDRMVSAIENLDFKLMKERF